MKKSFSHHDVLSRTRCFRLLLLGMLLCALALSGTALADYELSYEGTVTAEDSVPVPAIYGGKVSVLNVRKGDLVHKGDLIAEIASTLNYAPLEGTISGVYAAEGDDAESIGERYGAVLYIEPLHKYTIAATTDKAYNSSETHFIHLGETVYLSCVSDGSHYGTGIVSALTENGYNVEVAGGEFYIGEKVGIYRDPDYTKESCLGRGTLDRATPIAVKGSGSILKVHVKNGDFVERGQLLFETVEGVLDGLYSPQTGVTATEDGIIASVEASIGASVGKGDAVVKVYPLDQLQISFDLPEADLSSISLGDPVNIEFYWDNDGAMNTTGTITSVSHIGEAESESSDKMFYKTCVNFKYVDGIRIGMNVSVSPAPAEEAEEAEETAPAEEADSAEEASAAEETAPADEE